MPFRKRLSIAVGGRRMPLLALPAAILLVLFASCGGDDNPNANQLSPIKAGITIAPPSGDPVVWLDLVEASDDLITLDVKLRSSGPLEFSGFTLLFRVDPTVVQFAGEMYVPESDGLTVNPFGTCGSSSTYCGKYPYVAGTCTPVPGTCLIETGDCDTGGTGLCLNPAALNDPCTMNSDCDRGTTCDSGLDIGKACSIDANCNASACSTGRLTGDRCSIKADCEPATFGPNICQLASQAPGDTFLYLAGSQSGQCDSYIVPAGPVTDVQLLRVAFNVTSVTSGTRLELISQDQTGMSGDCAILDDIQVDMGIPCDDGMATITGTR